MENGKWKMENGKWKMENWIKRLKSSLNACPFMKNGEMRD